MSITTQSWQFYSLSNCATCFDLRSNHQVGRIHLFYRPRRHLRWVEVSSTLSRTSALDGVGVSPTPRPLLHPGKTQYPFYGRLGGPLGRSGQVRKISPPPGFDPRTVQPVARAFVIKTWKKIKRTRIGERKIQQWNVTLTDVSLLYTWFCLIFHQEQVPDFGHGGRNT